ncbi:MAG: hypothetical protein ISS81_08150 [Candidatus Marinimicrobia bacterium]|nr:hypothetical protein [Candidatus Neomarinimicrobiota bacterium]
MKVFYRIDVIRINCPAATGLSSTNHSSRPLKAAAEFNLLATMQVKNNKNKLEETMKKTLFVIVGIFFILNIIGCQQSKTIETPTVDGEKLVRKLWSDFKSNNKEVFENWIAKGFQSVHEDGARDRDEEIKLLMELNLGEYKLDNFNTTQNDNIVIVTYTVSAYETIAGNVLPTAPAERLSVFIYDKNDWKWIAHANLNPMDK